MSESSRPLEAKGRGSRKAKNTAKLGNGGPKPREGAELALEGGSKKRGVIRGQRDGHASPEKLEHRVAGPTGNGTRCEVGRDADVERNALPREPVDEIRVLDGANAVGDPAGSEEVEGVAYRSGPGPLSRVDQGSQVEPPDAFVDRDEVPGGNGRLVTSQSETEDARPGVSFEKVENTVRGAGTPLAYGVEKNGNSRTGTPFESRENRFQGPRDGEPGKPEAFDNRGRDIDLGVGNALAYEPSDEITREKPVIGGPGEFPADIAIEEKETGSGRLKLKPLANHGGTGENTAAVAPREREQGRRGDRSLEVKVQLGLGKSGEVPEEGLEPRRAPSTEIQRLPQKTAAFALSQSRSFERLWLRGAAFGIDLIALAGAPLLVSTLVIFLGLLFFPGSSHQFSAVFRAAQVIFTVAFLLRDFRGWSPGKHLLGLKVLEKGEIRSTVLSSVVRNLPLLLPGVNLADIALALRDKKGRRLGDRLAGTHVVEA